MGLVDWLKKLLDPEPPRPATPAKPARAATPRASRPASSRPAAPSPRTTAAAPWPFLLAPGLPDDARWIAANEQVEFQGIAIRGGLLYIGSTGSRPNAGFTGIEPSLIDPTLPVSFPDADSPLHDLPYWPAYATLTPRERGIYLRWLAEGRRDPRIPVGYPFLFLYGIERRLLLEQDTLDARALVAIRTEVAALDARYGPASESFHAACEQMTGLADLLQVEGVLASWKPGIPGGLDEAAALIPPPPPLIPNARPIPISLRIGLGVLALARRPIPPDWALAWAWYEPTTSIRAAAIRLPGEFATLFAIRYRARYGDGLAVNAKRLRRLELRIAPANATLGEQQIRATLLPDVVTAEQVFGVSDLIRIVANDLDEASRWLARSPDRAGSLSAWARLPDALRDPDLPFAAGVLAELDALMGAREVAIVPGERLLRLWAGGKATLPPKLTRPDGIALADALARLGFGIEPDPGTGTGTPITAEGSIALFRLPEPIHTSIGTDTPAEHAASQATILIDLAAMVGEADGAASLPEFSAMRSHLREAYALTAGEERRLGARLAWLAAHPASERSLAGVKKRIAPLSPEERDRLAIGLLRIVDADGAISPKEVTVLQKIWKLLGRDPDRVASDLHAIMTGGRLDPTPATATATAPTATTAKPPDAAPARRPKRTPPSTRDDPVIVRRATPEEPGVRIPPPPGAKGAPPEADLTLDPSAIARKIADTAAVSALLGNLLDDDATPVPSPASGPSPSQPDAAGRAQDGLLAALAGREAWPAEAFSALAEQHAMMPNAALDLLNDLGFEHAGDPLLIEEADGSLRVDAAVLATVREMTQR